MHECGQGAFDGFAPDHDAPNLEVSLPTRHVRLVFRDDDALFSATQQMTPRDAQCAKAPFSALPKLKMHQMSPFSPQFESVWRKFDFETPGTRGLQFNANDNNSFVDEPPLFQFDKKGKEKQAMDEDE